MRQSLAVLIVSVVCAAGSLPGGDVRAGEGSAADVVLPMERSAYYIGETVPLGIAHLADDAETHLELVAADGSALTLYRGQPRAIFLNTAPLAPGDYALRLNGQALTHRLTLVSVLRRSAASMQDEAAPPTPQFTKEQRANAQAAADASAVHWDHITNIYRASGVSTAMLVGRADSGMFPFMDAMARAGTMAMVNSDTRPTSFCPVSTPDEIRSMSRRMILLAQANGRFPNFAGFCYNWDPTGFAPGNRRMLLTYWQWGDSKDALRRYIENIDHELANEFTRTTGLAPVTEGQYIAYLLSIRRPEFATAIDLPTHLWLGEIARYTKPMSDTQRVAFEQRLDAWSWFLMTRYADTYRAYNRNIKSIDPTLRATASVQVDHAAVRFGQYHPSADEPLDFHYQSTWNDQAGGPDYAFQPLYTQAILEMHRGDKPIWISNATGAAHGRAAYAGKMTRFAAHGLPFGATGIGFAFEAFSTVAGSMNAGSLWDNVRDKSGGDDIRAGKAFLDRFASLATNARAEHGVGVLYSRAQYKRQHMVPGFGTLGYKLIVSLARLGYTPRFVTEEDLLAHRVVDLPALIIAGQTFPLEADVCSAIAALGSAGTKVIVDGNTTIDLPGVDAVKMDYALPFTVPGQPHNWSVPSMTANENDTISEARWHAELAPHLIKALGDVGRGYFTSDKGADTVVSLAQMVGGEARYLIAVNDSHVFTQADWYQVREKISPTIHAPKDAVMYDLTAETSLGAIGAADVDLTNTTARVLAVLPRAVKAIGLSATQKASAGQGVGVSVSFSDGDKLIAAVVPFHLALLTPDGKMFAEFYRATAAAGDFSMTIPLPINAAAGAWSIVVRSQLDGLTATLPLHVAPLAYAEAGCTPMTDRLIVRNREAIDRVLAKGAKVVLPIFDGPEAERRLAIAQKIKAMLGERGVQVDVREHPVMTNYTLAYELTDEQRAENAKAESGEAIGAVKRLTKNSNDWYAGAPAFYFGQPVILLDVTNVRDNPMAESLDDLGVLWPRVSAAFPGRGRGVVQGADWAFAPSVDALILQAADIDSLATVAESLGNLPADRLTPSVRAVREQVWRQYHVGGAPDAPVLSGLTADGLTTGSAPEPYRITFSESQPPTPDHMPERALKVVEAKALPATFDAKALVPQQCDEGRWFATGTPSFLVSDLRFSQGLVAPVEAASAGRVRITYAGVLRYSDRKPCWSPAWEDVLKLREATVPVKREPMRIDVIIGGKVVGSLTPTKTEEREVPMELFVSGAKPKMVSEEVVTELSGEVELSAGHVNVLLAPRNIVDGTMGSIVIAPIEK
ncbi:MAG: hypothetical protein GC162_13305 [Planctomycetes bacterium]|nr:hypothetical protein [Planctomycetota bacterium]